MNGAAHTPIDKWNRTSVGDELCADAAHVWKASLDQHTDMMKIVWICDELLNFGRSHAWGFGDDVDLIVS
jgi:hypothetical protein